MTQFVVPLILIILVAYLLSKILERKHDEDEEDPHMGI